MQYGNVGDYKVELSIAPEKQRLLILSQKRDGPTKSLTWVTRIITYKD